MNNYLLFNPETEEIRGPLMTSPEQVIWQTEGGAFRVFEMESTDSWRTVIIDGGSITETHDLGLIQRPLLRELDADANAVIESLMASGARGALYSAKEIEARGKGPKPILEAEAAETGETVAELSKKVIAAADASRANLERIGRIEGRRRAARAAVMDAKTAVELLKLPRINFLAA